jgi:hypothetical protein
MGRGASIIDRRRTRQGSGPLQSLPIPHVISDGRRGSSNLMSDGLEGVSDPQLLSSLTFRRRGTSQSLDQPAPPERNTRNQHVAKKPRPSPILHPKHAILDSSGRNKRRAGQVSDTPHTHPSTRACGYPGHMHCNQPVCCQVDSHANHLHARSFRHALHNGIVAYVTCRATAQAHPSCTTACSARVHRVLPWTLQPRSPREIMLPPASPRDQPQYMRTTETDDQRDLPGHSDHLPTTNTLVGAGLRPTIPTISNS